MLKRFHRELHVFRFDLDSKVVTSQRVGRYRSRARTKKWIQHQVVFPREQSYEPFRQRHWKGRAMASIARLGRKVEDICRIRHRSIDPIRDVLSEPALYPGFIAAFIGGAEVLQASLSPIAGRRHHALLIHLELSLVVELEAALPRIAKAVGPFAGVTILLVPDKFFGP